MVPKENKPKKKTKKTKQTNVTKRPLEKISGIQRSRGVRATPAQTASRLDVPNRVAVWKCVVLFFLIALTFLSFLEHRDAFKWFWQTGEADTEI